MSVDSVPESLAGGKPWTSDAAVRSTQVWLQPGMVNFGIGQPDFDLLPRELMHTAADHRLFQDNNYLLNYGSEKGDGYFRQALAEFLSKPYGVDVDWEQMVITAGASQGLDLICTLFTEPGQVILVEEPSYFLALRIFEDHGLHAISVPADAEGLNVDALEEVLEQHNPAFLYLIPAFQNPTGVTLTLARRQRLTELARAYDLLLVADEVYQLLDFKSPPPSPLAAFAEEAPILSLGSFSKILAPGLRLGWIHGSHNLIERIAGCGLLDSGGCANQFTAALVRSLLELNLLSPYLDGLKQTYAKRAQTLSRTLRNLLPEATFREPTGGFFHWLTLPDPIDTNALLPVAESHHVSFVPGSRFSSQDALHRCMRLSFAFHDSASLQLGVHRLRQALDEALSVHVD